MKLSVSTLLFISIICFSLHGMKRPGEDEPGDTIKKVKTVDFQKQLNTKLIKAATEGKLTKVKELLLQGAHTNVCNRKKVSPLIAAVNNNHYEVVKELLIAGADACQEIVESEMHGTRSYSYSYPLIVYAVKKGFQNIVNELIRAGANVNALDLAMTPILISAILHNHEDIALDLILGGANVRQLDRQGCTALKYAAQKGYKKVVEMICACCSMCDDFRQLAQGALKAAVESGNCALVVFLLQHDCISKNMDELQKALGIAFSKQYEDIKKVLIQVGADPRKLSYNLVSGSKPVDKNVIESLIKEGFNVNAVDGLDIWNSTPLIEAAAKNNCEVVKTLIENGALPNVQDSNHRTALSAVICQGNHHYYSESLDTMRGSGWYVPCVPYSSQSSRKFNEKLWSQAEEVLGILLKSGADIHIQEEHGNTPLMKAIAQPQEIDYKLVCMLLAFNKKRNIDVQNELGWTALMVAAHYGKVAIVAELLKYEPSINKQDKNGHTALSIAALEGSTPGDRITTPIEAQGQNYKRVVDILLQAGASVVSSQHVYDTLFVFAARTNYTELLLKLIEIKKYTKELLGEALTAAAGKGSRAALEQLLKLGTTLKDRNAAFGEAARHGQQDAVTRLISEGITINVNARSNSRIRENLASDGGSLLSLMNKISTKSAVLKAYLKDPLKYARKFVKELSVSKAELYFEENQTMLMWACMLGHTQVIEFLKDHNLSDDYLNAQDVKGQSALAYAIKFNHIETAIAFLKHFGKRLLEVRPRGAELLLYAIKQNSLKLLNALLEAGVVPTVEAAQVAAQAGYIPLAIRLVFKDLENDPRFNTVNRGNLQQDSLLDQRWLQIAHIASIFKD